MVICVSLDMSVGDGLSKARVSSPQSLKSMRLEAMAMVSASSVSSSDLSCFKISMNSLPQLLGPGPSRPRSSKRMSRTKASGPSSSSRPPLKGRNSRNLRTTSSAVLLLLLHRLTTNSRSGKTNRSRQRLARNSSHTSKRSWSKASKASCSIQPWTAQAIRSCRSQEKAIRRLGTRMLTATVNSRNPFVSEMTAARIPCGASSMIMAHCRAGAVILYASARTLRLRFCTSFCISKHFRLQKDRSLFESCTTASVAVWAFLRFKKRPASSSFGAPSGFLGYTTAPCETKKDTPTLPSPDI